MHGQNLHDRYTKAVAKLNIPPERKQPSPQNARWLLREGWITCRQHRDFARAREVAKQLSEL